jgi:hypothetical protein
MKRRATQKLPPKSYGNISKLIDGKIRKVQTSY